MSKAFKVLLFPLAVVLTLLYACNKSDDASNDDAVDQALYSIQERGGLGRFGCYELVFPVTILLPDSTTAEVDSYDDLKQTLRAYFEANGTPGAGGHHGQGGGDRPHPSFVYPITVVSQDGEVITVNSDDELRALRAACNDCTFDQHGPQGHGQHGLSCFEIVFPVTIEFPDSTTAQANSREELHQLIRTWRLNNPGVQERPKMVFPLTVKMTEDGTLVTVNNRLELHDLKESCE